MSQYCSTDFHIMRLVGLRFFSCFCLFICSFSILRSSCLSSVGNKKPTEKNAGRFPNNRQILSLNHYEKLADFVPLFFQPTLSNRLICLLHEFRQYLKTYRKHLETSNDLSRGGFIIRANWVIGIILPKIDRQAIDRIFLPLIFFFFPLVWCFLNDNSSSLSP